MSTAYPYKVKGARGSYNAEINGYEFFVSITLTDLTGDTDIDQLFNALTDGNIPLAGSDLSGIDSALTGCWLRKIDAGAISNRQMDVTLTYQQSQWGIVQIDIGSQLSQIETTKHLAGTFAGDNIKPRYEYPATYGGTTPSVEQERRRNTGETEQGGTVNVNIPEGSRIYTVRETTNPALLQQAYEGKVNDAAWWFREPREWLCVSITGTSDNSGVQVSVPETWINRYQFQTKLGGWDPEVVYSDDLTGEPVPDPVVGVGIFDVESYESFDFTELFPTPFVL